MNLAYPVLFIGDYAVLGLNYCSNVDPKLFLYANRRKIDEIVGCDCVHYKRRLNRE